MAPLCCTFYRAVLITFPAIWLFSSSGGGAWTVILPPPRTLTEAASFTRAHHYPDSHVPPLVVIRPSLPQSHHAPVAISPPKQFPFKFPAPSPLFLRRTPPTSDDKKKKKDFGLTPAAATAMDGEDCLIDVHKLRSDFLRVLCSRRTAAVPLAVEQAKPVKHPLFQDEKPPTFSEAMESCPKADIPNLKEKLKEENLHLITEAGEQGRLPILILSLKGGKERKPAVVFLHSTHKNKEWLRPLLEAYASRGYVSIAIDSRYHGERAHNKTTYRDALVESWKKGDTMPFIFDTAWDLIKLADYLTQREDIDCTRIGITGESLGGMHAWFGAFADNRYSVVVPIIGVQGFRWAIDNDKWQARVDSIRAVFEEARMDLSKKAIDKEVVEKVWNRIAPALASRLDAPYTVPAMSPRPLLILNGAEDPRCPISGIQTPMLRTLAVYEEANAADKFKVIAEAGIGHQMTKSMVKEASYWFDKYLKQ
ncbi:unnamed protein product [Linum tenue]|uniref:Peptidase S9 prolyl oligopeptidase catalytic domain-containing protein n=1 Tax=Linum tenue TaxID=586396 RepID=A0AAV0JGL5_9ROSI|nr:unnamed protein product [Linum tenue]